MRLLDKKDALLAIGRRDRAGTPTSCACATATGPRTCSSTGASAASATSACRFPVWYPLDADGQPDHDHPIVAGRERRCRSIPTRRRARRVHRRAARSAGRVHRRARRVRHLVHELADAADRLAAGCDDPERHAKLFPADIRPQSHEIIRTWAFYTIAKALLHEGTDPVAARGHLRLDPRSRPQEDVQEQGQRGDADAPPRRVQRRRRALLGGERAPRHRHRVRREGAQGRQAARHQALQRRQVRAGPGRRGAARSPNELDRAFVAAAAGAGRAESPRRLRRLRLRARAAAHRDVLLARFTDTYLELVKDRARGPEATPGASRRSPRCGSASACCCGSSRP